MTPSLPYRHLLYILLIVSLSQFTRTAVADENPILTIDTGGHMARIQEILFTSDGRYVVSASHDMTVRIWDAATAELVRVIRSYTKSGDEDKIYGAALSRDTRCLAIGGYFPSASDESNSIRLIDFRTGKVRGLLRGHALGKGNLITGLAFSPKGNTLISAGGDKTARIWDIDTQKTLHVLKGHQALILAVAFSPDGDLVCTGSNDATVKLWKTKTGTLIHTLTGHVQSVICVAFTPDGSYLLSGGKDGTLRLWNGRTGAFIKILATSKEPLYRLKVKPDSTEVIGFYAPSKVRAFSIPSGKAVALPQKLKMNPITDISPDWHTAATSLMFSSEIYLVDLKTGRAEKVMKGAGEPVRSVGFSKDGRSVAWGKKKDKANGRANHWGLVDRIFQLETETGENDLLMKTEQVKQSDYVRARESVGPWSIRIKKRPAQALQILEHARVRHEISRTPLDGYGHMSFTLTPDGNTVISGAANGHLSSYDAHSGQKVHDFMGHTSDIFGVAVSPNSRFLVSGSLDQTVKIWKISTGKLLLTIFQGSNNEWVAWTPEGYYAASAKGDRYIGWHVNRGVDREALFFPASRFAKQYCAPEIVAKYLETGGNIEKTINIVNTGKPDKKKFTKTTGSDLKAILPPVVFFKEPRARDITVENNKIRIQAGAKAVNQEPVTDIWLLVNGRRADGIRGINRVEKKYKVMDGPHAEIDLTIPLTEKDNRIAVVASNRYAQSEPEIIHVTWEKDILTPGADTNDIYKPDLYLLAIGVSSYKLPEYDLDFAHKDALALARVFERQKGALYRTVRARVLTDGDATKDNVLEGLDWILTESTQKDLSIILVSGHGLKDERGNYYFLPHDGDPEKLRRTGVKWFDFQDVLNGLPSKAVLMADTCHSGSITGKRRDATDMTDALRELLNAESGVVIMTASTGREQSREHPEWGHGAFTKAIIEGLEGHANYNKDETIDIKELDLFVTDRVKQLTKGTQHPMTEIPRTLSNFPVAYKQH